MSDGQALEAERFLKLLNNRRRLAGAPRLKVDDRLTEAAWSKVNCFRRTGVEPINHTCGGKTSTELRASKGYTAVGSEVLAWSERTASDVLDAWISSPVHNQELMSKQYRAVGIAGPVDLPSYYGVWVVEFGVEAGDSEPTPTEPEPSEGKTMLKSISSIPAPLRTVGNITRNTPIRLIGDIKPTEARYILEFAKSPMVAEFDAVYKAIAGHSAALLAISAKEAEYGRTAPARNNAFGVLDANGFIAYGSWAEGASAAAERFVRYDFKGGVYEPEISVGDFIYTYQGGPLCRTSGGVTCANGEDKSSIELSISQFLDRVNRMIRANGLTTAPPKPPTEPPVEPPSGEVVFGRVPRPANYAEHILAPGVNTAWNDLGPRKPRGLVLHRMIGTLIGTDSYFANEARHRALTDFGVGKGADGKWSRVIRWTQPGANVAPWASGPADGIDGDGTAFWNKYKSEGASIFNRDCESIELEGNYESPINEDMYGAIVELVAWRADAWLRIPYTRWPLNNDGVHCLLGHSEVTDQKPCPGSVVYALVPRLIVDVAARLKRYQLGA